MNKYAISLFSLLMLSISSVQAQRPTIGLTFTAKYQSQYMMLDSIYVQNLTQPGDTLLFAPDTVLNLNYVIGIHDYSGTAKTSFSVSPNYPNPSMDGKTAIDVFIPEREIVTMRVFDILGNEVALYENTLDAGNHHFTFLAGKGKYYVISVNCGNEIRSVKMINSGNDNQTTGTLIYQGMTEAKHLIKSQKAITGFDFSLGDQLRFIGYSKNPSGIIGSDVIEATPQGNEDFVFEIIEELPCPGIPIVTYEGQTYKTVQIGNQCWFKENLNLGTRIEVIENQANNSVVEKYCYDNDPLNCDVYGGLYQWDEMMQYSTASGAQGICPTSWHLPTDAEWTVLIDYLGGESVAGGKMKSTGTIEDGTGLWYSPNTGATNSSGFSGFPGGYSETTGNFINLGNTGLWWSSTELSATNAWHRYLTYGDIYAFSYNYNKNDGFSVRCVMNVNAVTPTVTTVGIADFTMTTATGGGEVTDDGGAEVTARGVCWSTSQNPTIADNHSSDGTGTGVFVSNLTGLTANTPYFVKAYATNSVGTAYGEEVTFTTLTTDFTQILYFTTRTTGLAGIFLVVLNDGIPVVHEFEPTGYLIRPYGIAADTVNDKVYVTDYMMQCIYRFDADGKNPLRILDASVPGQEIVGDAEGIFIHEGKIYWGRSGGIYRANLDGTNPEEFITTGFEYPLDMTFNRATGKIYLCNDKDAYSGGVFEVNIDGSGFTEIIPDVDVTAIEADFRNGMLYLAGYAASGTPIIEYGIYSCKLDGTELVKIGEYGSKANWGIAIDSNRNKLFWSFRDSNSNPDGKIIRANLDGTSPEDWLVNLNPVAITVSWVKLNKTNIQKQPMRSSICPEDESVKSKQDVLHHVKR